MSEIEDIENLEDLKIEDDFVNALRNEIKTPEFNRRIVKFKLRGDYSKNYFAIPMAELKNGAFLFKLENGTLKKINLKDMILESKNLISRAKIINEEIDWPEEERDYPHNEEFDKDDDIPYPGGLTQDDYEDDEFNEKYENVYILNDGTKIKMIEDSIKGMAGEPMTIRYFLDEDENQYWFRDIEDKLDDENKIEIEAMLKDDEDENYASAVNWVK